MSNLIFPTQIVLADKLPAEEYVWLSRLRPRLKVEQDIIPLARAYKGHKDSPAYQAVMDLIIRANQEYYKEDAKMCEALRELFADELVERENVGRCEGRQEGRMAGLITYIRKLSVKGFSAEDIIELLDEDRTIVNRVYQMIKSNPDAMDETIYKLL